MENLLKNLTLMKEKLEKLKQYEDLEKQLGVDLFEFVYLFKDEFEKIKLGGEQVEQEVIDEIKSFFIISPHALKRLEQRTKMIVRMENGDIDFKETVRNIKYKINRRLLAYYNVDKSINVAIDEYNYFVFEKNDKNHWVLITFKEKSYNNNNIFHKQRLAKLGINRN